MAKSRPAQGNNNARKLPKPRVDNSQRRVTIHAQKGTQTPPLHKGSMATATKPPSSAVVVQS